MFSSIDWIHWNETLPLPENFLIAYKLLDDGKDLNEEQENMLNWFITTIILLYMWQAKQT